jgi:hypothetical protein
MTYKSREATANSDGAGPVIQIIRVGIDVCVIVKSIHPPERRHQSQASKSQNSLSHPKCAVVKLCDRWALRFAPSSIVAFLNKSVWTLKPAGGSVLDVLGYVLFLRKDVIYSSEGKLMMHESQDKPACLLVIERKRIDIA